MSKMSQIISSVYYSCQEVVEEEMISLADSIDPSDSIEDYIFQPFRSVSHVLDSFEPDEDALRCATTLWINVLSMDHEESYEDLIDDLFALRDGGL